MEQETRRDAVKTYYRVFMGEIQKLEVSDAAMPFMTGPFYNTRQEAVYALIADRRKTFAQATERYYNTKQLYQEALGMLK